MCAETSFLQVLNNNKMRELLDHASILGLSKTYIVMATHTCEERLMSVVTTSTMTITVSNTLDKPTKGSTLE